MESGLIEPRKKKKIHFHFLRRCYLSSRRSESLARRTVLFQVRPRSFLYTSGDFRTQLGETTKRRAHVSCHLLISMQNVGLSQRMHARTGGEGVSLASSVYRRDRGEKGGRETGCVPTPSLEIVPPPSVSVPVYTQPVPRARTLRLASRLFVREPHRRCARSLALSYAEHACSALRARRVASLSVARSVIIRASPPPPPLSSLVALFVSLALPADDVPPPLLPSTSFRNFPRTFARDFRLFRALC